MKRAAIMSHGRGTGMNRLKTNSIELEGIHLRRGGKEILRGIDWTVAEGERWALLGANGSGKTTLLKVITGYEWPTEGRVSALGERFGECNLPELRKRIGWVSSALEHRFPAQCRALEVALSGFEASIGVYREFTAREIESARAAMATVGVEALAERVYDTLSQGEKQRTLLARALVHAPALLILDEPCAGLDPVARENFLADLERLGRRDPRLTILLVTHHIEEISLMFSRTLILKEGRALACGPTAEALTSDVMSRALGRPCVIERHNSRYWMRF